MPLSAERAEEQARILKGFRDAESDPLATIRRYWKGRQELPAVIPSSAPKEVRVMARIARVNVCPIVVDSLTQSTFVDGFRGEGESEDADVWAIWQANKMDARQTGIHRAAYAYGTAYTIVLPGDPVPVIRGASPRILTTVYGEDRDWPLWGLEDLGLSGDGRGHLWRLYDDEATYFLSEAREAGTGETHWRFIGSEVHGLGVTPIVRYVDEDDLDGDNDVDPDERPGEHRDPSIADRPMRGQIAPLMPLQDQIDLTTFGLLVAQHYGAFRQRYIMGWAAPNEQEAMKAAASVLWQFEDVVDEEGNEIKIGEFEQTNLDGYIKSREASLTHAATLSQTPVHELVGEMVNLSAEALVAAEKGRDRKVDERQANMGESHEQTLWLAGRAQGLEVPDEAQVVWRDTSARAFSATVDALGKLVQMLGVPPQELWERVPNTTRQDVERWKAAAEQGNAFAELTSMLDRQANGAVDGGAD